MATNVGIGDKPAQQQGTGGGGSSSSSNGSSGALASSNFPPLWLQQQQLPPKDDPMIFHEEVMAFARWIAPSAPEREMRLDVVQRVSNVVRKLWPEAKVDVFGSFETGLCVPQSDIDVVVFGATGDLEVRLSKLATELEAAEVSLGRPLVIASAKVPIVKMGDAKSGCIVDISFDCDSGPATTTVILNLLSAYPLARPLILVAKYYLKQKYLNDTWSGGIGSYTLVLMVVFYIQVMTKGKGDPNKVSPSENLATMLPEFFEYFGQQFDYVANVISVSEGGKFVSKEEKKWVHEDRPDSLAVQDPLVPENDVGFSSFRIDAVRNAFRNAHTLLAENPLTFGVDARPSFLRRLVKVPSVELKLRRRIADLYGPPRPSMRTAKPHFTGYKVAKAVGVQYNRPPSSIKAIEALPANIVEARQDDTPKPQRTTANIIIDAAQATESLKAEATPTTSTTSTTRISPPQSARSPPQPQQSATSEHRRRHPNHHAHQPASSTTRSSNPSAAEPSRQHSSKSASHTQSSSSSKQHTSNNANVHNNNHHTRQQNRSPPKHQQTNEPFSLDLSGFPSLGQTTQPSASSPRRNQHHQRGQITALPG